LVLDFVFYVLNLLQAAITNKAIGGPQGAAALGAYIGVAVKTVLILGAISVLALLAWGAFQILTSGGDTKAQEKGRNIITSALIGLVLLVALFPIVKALEVILNISILKINFPSVLG
jgi:NADH:ubiquinone oxidoreductase subunit 6 (subunit J)